MKALLQRVSEARVEVDGEIVGRIDAGLLIFLGVERGDTQSQADWLADRALGLRIFADDAKPMNRSVVDIGGDVLVVSQFTLAADTRRGRRPGFSSAAEADKANALYEYYVDVVRQSVGAQGRVQTGRFAADMKVHLVNDGPVTFMLETPPGIEV